MTSETPILEILLPTDKVERRTGYATPPQTPGTPTTFLGSNDCRPYVTVVTGPSECSLTMYILLFVLKIISFGDFKTLNKQRSGSQWD